MAGLKGFYGREDLADLDVVIVQANTMACDKSSRRKRSRAEELVLPGHRLAVCAASEVLSAQVNDLEQHEGCRTAQMVAERNLQRAVPCCLCCPSCFAQILNWSAAAPSKQRQRINIEVPAGQLEVGRLLLRCMYQQQPDLRSTEQQATPLQLLVLADKYAVPGAVAAVNRAFKETPVEQLLCETVVAVYELPAVYADNAAFADVYAAAADVLQHTLGDLELVFADQSDRQGSKQQLLYDLPHAGLLQLLRDERTRVASENTAAHALLEWSEDKDISPEHLKQLVSALVPEQPS